MGVCVMTEWAWRNANMTVTGFTETRELKLFLFFNIIIILSEITIEMTIQMSFPLSSQKHNSPAPDPRWHWLCCTVCLRTEEGFATIARIRQLRWWLDVLSWGPQNCNSHRIGPGGGKKKKLLLFSSNFFYQFSKEVSKTKTTRPRDVSCEIDGNVFWRQ